MTGKETRLQIPPADALFIFRTALERDTKRTATCNSCPFAQLRSNGGKQRDNKCLTRLNTSRHPRPAETSGVDPFRMERPLPISSLVSVGAEVISLSLCKVRGQVLFSI